MNEKKLETVLQKLKEKALPVRRVLQSPDGAALMAALEAEFVNGDLLGDTPEKTAFNLGAREVVMYLRRLRDLEEKLNGR